MDQDTSRWLRSASAALAPEEALRAPPGALLGVTSDAETALATLEIHSVFDLAASRVFAVAAELLALEHDPTAAAVRLNVVAGDVAQMPPGVPVQELGQQPIAILRGVGEAAAPELAAALDVETVRDLALWPPYSAAKAILAAAFFPEQAVNLDGEAPVDLLPKSGVYPTERVFFRKLVIDAVPEPGEGAEALEQAGPIDLVAALAAPAGFSRLATGALLSFSQSWFSQGLTLGQLLHSTSLAPGESTRIAMVDWERRSRAAASEDISESELLSNTMTHSRAISEVTNATATEFQSGKSSTSATSTTEQGGVGFGLEIGPLALGGSGAAATTSTEVMSASSSFGARELAAGYAQDINDRSQQNASSVRNRRASIVREVSQAEHEQISTRVLTNYNHMHALSVQYFEVVQAFRATTQLERAERCLFVPVKLVDFTDPALVDRWRLRLAAAALTERARRQLTVEYGVVEVIPQTPRITPGKIIVAGDFHIDPSGGLSTKLAGFGAAPTSARSMATDGGGAPGAPPAPGPSPPPSRPPPGAPPPPADDESSPPSAPPAQPPPGVDYRRAPINNPAALLALKGWDIEQLNRIGWTTGRVLMQGGSDSVFVSDDGLLVGCSLRAGQAVRFVVRLRTGQEVTPAAATATAVTFAAPLALTEIDSIAVQFAGPQDLRTALVLQLNLLGTVMPLDVPIVLRPSGAPAEVVKFGTVMAARELVAHLEANRLHYTQAILRGLDAATVAALLARYTYRELPLGMLVDPQPIAITANFLVFKMNVATAGEADDPRWAEEQTAWQAWLQRRGLDRPAPKSEIIPLPSGGVFAEAVLGRSNAAEKTDLTRFWNWQDSPIPLTAPEIAPLQAGSRATAEDLQPGQLSAPVLGLQAPTALPDAAGIAAIIQAVQNGNMFRDMSGMAQTAALAQAALQASAAGATAVGEQAAQNLKTVMDNNTERMRIAAALATGGASGVAGAAGGGGGTGSRPAKNVTEEGARLNFARDLDARGGGGAAGGGATGSGGGTGGATDVPSPEFGASTETTSPSVERQLFDRQTGGVTANLAEQVADAAAAEEVGDGGGGGGGSGPAVIEPFPVSPYPLTLDTANPQLTGCGGAFEHDPDVSSLCGAVADVTGRPRPALPPFFGMNQTDMLYVASLAKIYAMYAAYELRQRVEAHTKAMIADGLSTSTAGWESKVFVALEKAWKPKLNAAFPRLPQGFPKLANIFILSSTGDVNFAERDPPLTDAELDAIGEFGTPQGKFRDWMRLMLRWSNNEAASRCILPLSYPYINGALAAAGFFDSSAKKGLWLSGDYLGHDWLPNNRAGQPLSPRWAALQGRATSNFTGTSFQVGRFMTLLAKEELIDAYSSTDMISILNGASGIGSYIKRGLELATPPRSFGVVKSKIGFGDDGFSHDCAIVTVDRGGDPMKKLTYVSVVLGSPPDKGRTDLRKLAVGYHDCIVARHPVGGP